MMREQYSEMARRWVRWLRPEAPPRLPVDRRRLVSAVEEALRARARQRTLVRWGGTAGGVAVAAAAALVIVIRLHPWGGAAGPATAQREAPAEAGRHDTIGITPLPPQGVSLEPGIQLAAPAASEVRIDAADGTALTLEPGGRLAVMEAGATRRFALRHGAVRAKVVKLGAGERFVIDTADSEIEVHGTAFRVALVKAGEGCAGGPRTRVSVSEGVVSVKWEGREVRLLPGEQWPDDCAERPAPEPRKLTRRASPKVRTATAADAPASRELADVENVEASAPVAAAADDDDERALAPAPAPRLVGPPPSWLPAHNDLYAAALRAKRRGHAAEAVRLFATLVRRYPEGPLVESALAQRMKLLAAMDPEEGGAAAADYLARYPGGFARADARRLVKAAAKP
jgi:hypothetical protein